MAFGAPGINISPSASNGRHKLQLLSNFIQGSVFRQPLERIEYGLLVSHE
jgi:hypothetical protein